jgi:vacuolar protein sorting-associated protein 45
MADLVAAAQAYILRALEEAGPGMKVMLLDEETTPIVSLAFAQSALMKQEVFLFERLQAAPSREDMRHLRCIAVLRPEQETLRLLAGELASPRYGSYHLYFTNMLPKAAVKQLAEADMQEVVKEIKEIYIDYLPIGWDALFKQFSPFVRSQEPICSACPSCTPCSRWGVGEAAQKGPV